MINNDMRLYDFSTLGGIDEYGQPQKSQVQGQVKMAINIISQSIQDNVIYREAQYIGLTHDNAIDDSYLIHYGEEKLKVLYINPKGRYKQVFMATV